MQTAYNHENNQLEVNLSQNYYVHIWKVFYMGIIKQCTHLHSHPPTPTHPQPPPLTQNNAPPTPTHPYLPKIMPHLPPLTPTYPNNVPYTPHSPPSTKNNVSPTQTTLSPGHLFTIRGKWKRGPGTILTCDQNLPK